MPTPVFQAVHVLQNVQGTHGGIAPPSAFDASRGEEQLMARHTAKRANAKAPKEPDAVHMLKADHKQVKQLFHRFRTAPADERRRIAGQLFAELEIHTVLEEELFYPALRRAVTSGDDSEVEATDAAEDAESEEFGEEPILNGVDLDTEEDEEETDLELLASAYEDHQAVKELLEQLRTLDPSSQDFRDVFAELEDAVIGHVTEEEDSLFPIAAAELDTRSLGATMQRRRDDLSSSLAA